MPTDHRLFLTHAQAKAAIRADLSQYAHQKRLYRDLCLHLLGKHTVAGSAGEDGIWIETGKFGKMRKITWEALRRRLIAAVAVLPPDLSALAGILTRVFDAPAVIGTDDTGRQKGIWLETGMADFNCRRCGRCCRCLDYHDQCSVQDVRRWRLTGRHELIARARPVRKGGRIDHYRIWTSLDGKILRQTCPWLKPTTGSAMICSIQDHKPEICRQYPGSRKHALMTGCLGFDTPPDRPPAAP